MAKNSKMLKQYKSKFSLLVEQTLAFALSNNLVRVVKNLSPSIRQLHIDVLHYR